MPRFARYLVYTNKYFIATGLGPCLCPARRLNGLITRCLTLIYNNRGVLASKPTCYFRDMVYIEFLTRIPRKNGDSMKIKRHQLRQSAPVALSGQGYSGIELISGPGIVPGARLRALKDGKSFVIAVRTSSDREVGLLRTPKGKWRTIPNVDLVVIAVPANDAPAVEVLAFEPEPLLEVFDAKVRSMKTGKPNQQHFRSPVFVALDDVRNSKTKRMQPGLLRKAHWQTLVPLDQVRTSLPMPGDENHGTRFYEQIKKQIADFVGIDAAKITLTISITP